MTLLILAAGMGSRFGGIKQIEPMGENGELIIDYSIFDAVKAGFNKVVFVIRHDIEKDFCERIFDRIKVNVKAEYVFQDINDLPAGYKNPEGRTKPWGTVHAVLAAKDVLTEPFCMINADDFYGREAYCKIAEFFKGLDKDDKYKYASVCYRVMDTLSGQGGVSRGICEVDKNGYITEVNERHGVEKRGNDLGYITDGGKFIKIDKDAYGSMNFFGFTPDIMPILEKAFAEFVKNNKTDLKAELPVPVVLGEYLANKTITMKCLTSNDHWIGFTYKEDKPIVQGELRRLVEGKIYPAPLWKAPSGIKFGTSGFRGIIGDNFTKANVQKIGNAFRQMIDGKKIKIIVGYDNRFMGEFFAKWFIEASACENIAVTLCPNSVTTPFIAYMAREYDFGIMITASHNPYQYNGITFQLHGGREADDEFWDEMTANINNIRDTKCVQFPNVKTVSYLTDADEIEYERKLLSLVDCDVIKKAELNILFNPMYGSSSKIMLNLLNALNVKATVINGGINPNFDFDSPAPYPHKLGDMQKQMRDGNYDFGIALDGDGDRITYLSKDGTAYNCNTLGALFYYYYAEIKKTPATLVKNVMTSNLAAVVAKKYKQDVIETQVGFKFLGKAMETSNALVAVEPDGIAFKDMSLRKDAVAPSIVLLELAAKQKQKNKTIDDLIKEIVESFPSYIVNTSYPLETIEEFEVVKEKITSAEPKIDGTVGIDRMPGGLRVRFKNNYWATARLSGTESCLRIYMETKDKADADKIEKILKEFCGVK